MAAVKTAISIPEKLFRATERMSRAAGISRSQLISLALEDYLRRHRADAILGQLNRVYGAEESAEDKKVRHAAMRHASKLIEGTW